MSDEYVHSWEVTRAGSSLVIRGNKWIGLFDIHGTLLRRLLYEPTLTLPVGLARAYSDDRRRGAIWQGDHLLLLDEKGRPAGTVLPAFDDQMRTLYNGWMQPAHADAVTTDWHGRWWYLLNGFVVEVDAQ